RAGPGLIGGGVDAAWPFGYGHRVVGHLEWSRASFRTSLVPMVIADHERRYVAANPAACLLLRLPEEKVLGLRIDDLTPQRSARASSPCGERSSAMACSRERSS